MIIAWVTNLDYPRPYEPDPFTNQYRIREAYPFTGVSREHPSSMGWGSINGMYYPPKSYPLHM